MPCTNFRHMRGTARAVRISRGNLVVKTSAKIGLLNVGAIALLASAAVHAEEAAAPQGRAPARADGASSGIEEVVVTAQKQSENLQKTAAAVTAMSGDLLVQTGTTDLRAVQNLVPAARFQQEGATTQVVLRGVGSNLDFGNVEPVVAFNLNGMYTPREGTSQPLFDLESIEVLPGPQGTLYGRNALGGTINVTFKRPTRENETSGTVEAGNYGLIHTTLVQNVAVSENLAIRGAVDYTKHDGYMESGAYSKDDIAGRIGVLYAPSEDVSLYVWGTVVTKDGSPANLVNKGTDPSTFTFSENAFLRSNPYADLRPGALAGTAIFGQPIAEKQKYDLVTVGGQFDIGVGDGMTLSYIPGYLSLDSNSRYWLGVLPAEKADNYRLTTHELRLSGNSANLEWLAGLYGYSQKTDGYFYVGRPTGPFGFVGSSVLNSRLTGIAAFGQATYSFTDTVRLTVGGRASFDDRKANGISPDNYSLAPYSFKKSFSKFDYKIGVEKDLADAVMGYLTFQTGYQPGTFNEVPNTPTQSNLINPPSLSAFTGGFKTRFLENRMQVNVEAFYYSYKDLLVQAYDASKPYNKIFNAEATSYGVQLDSIYQPTDDDRLSLSLSWLHARNDKFAQPGLTAYEGFSLPYAADKTINVGYHHDFHLAGGYLRAQADARFESEYYADFVHTPGVRQAPTWRENASLTYYAESQKWTAGLWIKNLSNKAVIAATAAAGIPGPATAYLEEPRTYGARVTFKF